MTTQIIKASEAVIAVSPSTEVPMSTGIVLANPLNNQLALPGFVEKKVEGVSTMRAAFEKAGLNFKVEKRQLSYPQMVGDKVVGMLDHPNQFATVRTDTQKSLGTVGRTYHVIDNWDGCEILDLMCSGALGVTGTIENVGYLSGGSRVFAQVNIGSFLVKGKDKVLTYLTFTNTHDGSLQTTYGPTGVRIVCLNTHQMATREAGKYGIQIRHTSKAGVKMEEAKKKLILLQKAFKSYEAQANFLADVQLTSVEAKALTMGMLGLDPASEPTKQKLAQVELILAKAERGVNDSNYEYRGSAWALYNGVTEVVNHHSRTRGGNENERKDNLAFSRMYGQGKNLMDKSFSTLLDYGMKKKGVAADQIVVVK